MTLHRLWQLLKRGSLIVVALALLAGCTPPATPVPPVEPTELLAEPTQPPGDDGYVCSPLAPDFKSSAAVAAGHYILNQVIITGPAGRVEKITSQMNLSGAGLTPIQTCTLGHLTREEANFKPWSEHSNSRDAGERVAIPPDLRAELITGLYSLPPESSVEEVVTAINELGREEWVFADPNYLTGPLEANPVSPCAIEDDPFEVGGSPFEVGGSPFEVGGSSTGGLPAPADASAFWTQWAFEQIGLGADGRGRGRLSGEGVTVAVFDTSPFQPGAAVGTLPEPINLTLAFPPLANDLPPAPVPAASGGITNPVNVADHGLFVAGLVYAVAPRSQIHLVRVLNEYGCGDLWTLTNAINQWTAQQSSESKEQRLDKTVLNLSLGVHQPRDFAKANWPPEIVSLDQALFNATSRGAVIVAASGNDSYDSAAPRPMQLPADWPTVIGVAASNREARFACYSNQGDLLAPGADGGPWKDHACQPIAHTCAPDDAGCPFGVVSLATQPEPGYRFWVGTSFAAPLVSGQAALLLEGNLAAAQTPGCILNTAVNSGGQRIVNVAASVTSLGVDPWCQ